MKRRRTLLTIATVSSLAYGACGDTPGAPATEQTRSAFVPLPGETESWTRLRFFESKIYGRAVFDEARSEFVFLPGYAASPETSNTTWTWNGALTLKTPKMQPGVRAQASVAYDRDKKRVILFGGSGQGAGETWAWDGTDWTNLSPPQSPPPRYAAPMTYDPVRKVVLLAGGYDGVFRQDTWSFDGQTWRDETPATAKLPRTYAEASMLFDENEGVPLALIPDGGPGGCSTQGLWRYRAGEWKRENAAGVGPTICLVSAGFDTTRKIPVVFGTLIENAVPKGSKIWGYNGTWSDLSSPAEPLTGSYTASAAAFGGGTFVVAGGQTLDGLPIHSVQSWDGTWKVDASSRTPGYRPNASFTTLANGDVFLFGGTLTSTGRDVWTFDGSLWQERVATTRPPARSRGRVAFDSKRNEVVLFGGYGATSQWLTDTWTWNNGTWTEHTGAVHPGPLSRDARGMAVYDPVRDRTFVLDNTGPQGSVMRVWSWDGQSRQWTLLPASPGPLGLQDGSFAYDPIRNVSVFFGGDSLDDTWTWDGSVWTRVNPKNRPGGRRGASFAWDALHERLVLFGGAAAGGVTLNDVWTWDGQDWTSLVNANASPNAPLPAVRESAPFAATGKNGDLLLFSGQGPQGVLGDAWIFRTRGGACSKESECASGHCVDGVCCESAKCGTCETCAGLDRGVCTAVVNDEDRDTCGAKDKKRCNAAGQCIGDVSAACKSVSDCASGFCVDGVCCNTACDLPCEACAASHKLVATEDGRCGAAKVGENPGGRCASGASCNATGSCETRTPGSCRTDRLLDPGNGQLQDCAPYRCASGTCERSCKTYEDCAFPATCSPEGRCETRSAVADSGGCSTLPSGRSSSGRASTFAALVALLLLRRLSKNHRAAR